MGEAHKSPMTGREVAAPSGWLNSAARQDLSRNHVDSRAARLAWGKHRFWRSRPALLRAPGRSSASALERPGATPCNGAEGLRNAPAQLLVVDPQILAAVFQVHGQSSDGLEHLPRQGASC